MKWLGKIFLTGILTVLPVLATVYLVIWLFSTVEHFLGSSLRWLIPQEYYRAGMGLLVALAMIFVVGVLMRAYIVRRVFGWAEKLFLWVPLVKSIYRALRDLFGIFVAEGEQRALQVVSVQLPGSQMRVLGFVTRAEFSDLPAGIGRDGEVAVYLPMSYQVGGYTVFMPRTQLMPIEISREEAMRFVLTAGLKSTPPHK